MSKHLASEIVDIEQWLVANNYPIRNHLVSAHELVRFVLPNGNKGIVYATGKGNCHEVNEIIGVYLEHVRTNVNAIENVNSKTHFRVQMGARSMIVPANTSARAAIAHLIYFLEEDVKVFGRNSVKITELDIINDDS